MASTWHRHEKSLDVASRGCCEWSHPSGNQTKARAEQNIKFLSRNSLEVPASEDI